jgi:hypothetical protein
MAGSVGVVCEALRALEERRIPRSLCAPRSSNCALTYEAGLSSEGSRPDRYVPAALCGSQLHLLLADQMAASRMALNPQFGGVFGGVGLRAIAMRSEVEICEPNETQAPGEKLDRRNF